MCMSVCVLLVYVLRAQVDVHSCIARTSIYAQTNKAQAERTCYAIVSDSHGMPAS